MMEQNDVSNMLERAKKLADDVDQFKIEMMKLEKTRSKFMKQHEKFKEKVKKFNEFFKRQIKQKKEE